MINDYKEYIKIQIKAGKTVKASMGYKKWKEERGN